MLTKAGSRIPEEMSLVSFGGANRPNALAKRLTAVTVDETTTAKLTAQLLDEMRRQLRPLTDSTRYSVPLGFYAGDGVGRAKCGALLQCMGSTDLNNSRRARRTLRASHPILTVCIDVPSRNAGQQFSIFNVVVSHAPNNSLLCLRLNSGWRRGARVAVRR